jgi:Flp pilus assembly protein TadG
LTTQSGDQAYDIGWEVKEIMKKNHGIIKGEMGVAAIEFAIVLPVVFLLLIGIIEFSILLYDKGMITNASREGARFGIVFTDPLPRYDEGNIEGVVKEYASANLINFNNDPNALTATAKHVDDDNTELDVSAANAADVIDTGEALKVVVTYNHGFLVLPNFMTGLSDAFTITAETIMRYE